MYVLRNLIRFLLDAFFTISNVGYFGYRSMLVMKYSSVLFHL